MDLFAKGILQGSVPVIVLVGGTHYFVKKFRESKPVLYWGSIAVATGAAIGIVTGRIPAPFMNAETFGAELEDCYVCDGMFKQVYVCDNDCGFQCCEIDIDGNLIPVENADGTVKDYCITCYEEKYGAETFEARRNPSHNELLAMLERKEAKKEERKRDKERRAKERKELKEELKKEGLSKEEINQYLKDLAWERRHGA